MAAKKSLFTLRLVLSLLVVLVAGPLLPMIISRDWRWPEAWLYALGMVLTFILSRALASRRHPDLIAERARFMEARDTKPWDKVLAPALGFVWILMIAVAGVERYFQGPFGFPLAVKIISGVMIVLGYWISSWALIENRFFSGTVRIQSERGHRVVSTGPYRFVRHPGYLGGLLLYMFTPSWYDSVWAFLPALLLAVVVVVRTALEDRTLQEELPGYREFAARTRYRLLPGVW